MKTIVVLGNSAVAGDCYAAARNYLSCNYKNKFSLLRAFELSPEVKKADVVLFTDGNEEEIASFMGLYAKKTVFSDCSVITGLTRDAVKISLSRGEEGRSLQETETFSELGIEKVARTAFETAERSHSGIVSVDRSDNKKIGEFWRKAVHEVAQDYPTVSVCDESIENAICSISKGKIPGKIILTNPLCGGIISKVLSEVAGKSLFVGLFGRTSVAAFGVKNVDSLEAALRAMIEECFEEATK